MTFTSEKSEGSERMDEKVGLEDIAKDDAEDILRRLLPLLRRSSSMGISGAPKELLLRERREALEKRESLRFLEGDKEMRRSLRSGLDCSEEDHDRMSVLLLEDIGQVPSSTRDGAGDKSFDGEDALNRSFLWVPEDEREGFRRLGGL